MARRRRNPSPAPPPPPPPPPQESSTESGSDSEEEEEPPRAAAAQKPPQNPQSRAPVAAADDDGSSEEESDSDADAQDFQMRPVLRSPTKPSPAAPQPPSVLRSPTKPAPAAPQPESDADEEEDGESSESEPEVPEPVQKKAAVTKKSKAAEQEQKKRPAPEPAPSSKSKKAKAETRKAAPEATPAGKGKKVKAEPEKAAPQPTPSSKAKKPVGKLEKSELNPSPSSKSDKPARAPRTWSKEDLVKILEAMAAHVKSEGVLPKTDVLLAAVRDHLDRKDCSHSDLYEKVRGLKNRYEKAVSTGVVPSGEDELRMYNLSEAIWGKKAKEAITAAASQNDSIATKSKKGPAKKDKSDGNSEGGTLKEVANQNGDAQKGSKKGHAIEVKTSTDVKSKLLKEDTTAGTSSKSKKQGNGKDELGKDAKSGTTKEATAAATQNGDAMTKRKRGKMDKEKMDIDRMPKEVSTGNQNGGTRTASTGNQNGGTRTASTGNQNGGTRTEDEIHEMDAERVATVHGTHRKFDELQNQYPGLAWYVERIEAQNPCGETLKRAFGFIGDEKANALEFKIKKQRLSEVKVQLRRADLQKEVVNMLIGLAD